MKHNSLETMGPLDGADNLIGSMYVDLYPHETALIQLSGGCSSDIDSLSKLLLISTYPTCNHDHVKQPDDCTDEDGTIPECSYSVPEDRAGRRSCQHGTS